MSGEKENVQVCNGELAHNVVVVRALNRGRTVRTETSVFDFLQSIIIQSLLKSG